MARLKDRLILMGRIGAAHGIRGEVRVQSFTGEPLDLVRYNPFVTNRPGLQIVIETARGTTNMLVARLAGIGDRDAAERLNGVELYVERGRLPAPEEEDDFYHADLIGLAVRLTDGAVIGEVSAVLNHGAGDIIEVRGTAGDSFLYPFTRAVVPEVHVAEGYLVVAPPLDAEPGEEEPD